MSSLFLSQFNLGMDEFASSGFILSSEEQMLLKISLPILQMENNFSSVSFWGKVFGSQSDYYIAQGRGKDHIRNKMSFYSLDGQVWRLMFPPEERDLFYFHLVRTPFTGDPTVHHRFVDPSIGVSESDMKDVMLEESRLSTLVMILDLETTIAPQGAFVLSSSGKVVPNELFRGLPPEKAVKLESYVHLRLPECDGEYVPLTSSPGDYGATDFLEPIDRDIPKGCWIMDSDEVADLVILRNLLWQGYTFYHIPGQKNFGNLYMGYGQRNDDLPFMML